MKKILGAALALALVTPGPAGAEMFKNLKMSGGIDVQNTSARNVYDFATRPATAGGGANQDRVSTTITRVTLNADWDLLDDVHAQGTVVKNDRAWGAVGTAATTGGQGTSAGGDQGLIGAARTGDVAGNLVVKQANFTVDKLMGHFDAKIGRQFYGEPGDLILFWGNKDTYGLFSTSIDGLKVDAENDWMHFDGLAATLVTGAGVLGAAENKTHLRGFDIGWKNLPLKANTFIWNRVTQAAGGSGVPTTTAGAGGQNDFLYVYGVKLHGEAAGGWMTLQAAANAGEDRLSGPANGAGCTDEGCNAPTARYTGSAFLLDLGYNAEVANVGGFTPWANFGWGSGRSSNFENHNEGFQAISSDFRPGIINRRFAGAGVGGAAIGAANLGNALAANGGFGTNGLNNRVVWGLGLNVTPSSWDKLTAGVSLWDYRFQRNTQTVAAPQGIAKGNKHIGSEYGLTAEWRHSENVSLNAGWARFAPGGFINESVAGVAAANGDPVNVATLMFADLSVKF